MTVTIDGGALELKDHDFSVICALDSKYTNKLDKTSRKIILYSQLNRDGFWTNRTNSISSPGQFSVSEVEVECKEMSGSTLAHNFSFDGLKAAYITVTESMDQVVESVGDLDVLVLNLAASNPNSVAQIVNNSTPNLVILCGPEEYTTQVSVSLNLTPTILEGNFKFKPQVGDQRVLQSLVFNID